MSFPRSPYTGFPFDAEATEQFPFNRQRTRGANLQSTLDDIAQRHPKIAKHLTNFNNPRTDRTGFPFDDDDIDFDRYARQFYEHPQDHPQSSKQHETRPEQSDQPGPQETAPNLQQSDSFDSSRRREGIDERSPRSSSAPPGGDIDRELGAETVKEPPGNMAQQEHGRDGKPVERIIPILLEGRDEPIVPKNTGIPRQEQSHTQQGSNRRGFDEDQVDRAGVSDEHFSRHNCPGVQIPVQKDVPVSAVHKDKLPPQPPHQPPKEHEQCKPEPPRPAPLSPIEQIQAIKQDVSKLLEDVEKFDGKTKDKQYLYLDEMLTRNLLKLDDIDTQGQENIRSSRKEAIKCIQEAISLLENKVKCGNAGGPSESGQCMEVDETAEKVDCAANEANLENRAVLVSDDNAENCDAKKETRAVLVDGPRNGAECAAKESEGIVPAAENVQETDAKKEKKGK